MKTTLSMPDYLIVQPDQIPGIKCVIRWKAIA